MFLSVRYHAVTRRDFLSLTAQFGAVADPAMFEGGCGRQKSSSKGMRIGQKCKFLKETCWKKAKNQTQRGVRPPPPHPPWTIRSVSTNYCLCYVELIFFSSIRRTTKSAGKIKNSLLIKLSTRLREGSNHTVLPRT